MKKYTKHILLSICIFFVVLIAAIIFFNKSYAASATQHVEIDEGSELMYNITVDYDGRDKNGIQSTDNTIANIISDEITVEDQIPDGMEFIGFQTSTNGRFLAHIRNGEEEVCPGNVIDDTNEEGYDTGVWNANNTEYTYHGLHYNKAQNKVTFRVENIKAGCTLTIGVKIKAPDTIDDPNTQTVEKRRDFYNTAYSHERSLNQSSNIVHTYMGDEEEFPYRVIYEYTGTPPENAPNPPAEAEYNKGAQVTVAAKPNLEGYIFNGWTSSDVTISNNKFTMPAKDVVLTGTFTQRQKYKVKYIIEGDLPDGYTVPTMEEYYQGETVTVDSLQENAVVNGYMFSGWRCNVVQVTNGKITMPSTDVIFTGSFNLITYNVSYQFRTTTLPPNYQWLLPSDKRYPPGETVPIEPNPEEPDGYVFLGWDKTEEFTMPENDVIIYGEWREQTGVFEPTVAKTIINSKTYYKIGDKVEAKITITNPSSIVIKDVTVKDEGIFDNISGYTILSDHVAKIAEMQPGASVDLYTKYTVQSTDVNTIEQTASIVSATADDGYELKNKKYLATISFTIQSRLKICNSISGTTLGDSFEYSITNTANGFETTISLSENTCKTLYLDPARYRVKEIIPQEYGLNRVEGSISSNNAEVPINAGASCQVTFTNRFIKKGFFHSIARKINRILQEREPEDPEDEEG